MAVVLTVNGSSFEFPQNNEDPNWAQDTTAWANAVTIALNSVLAGTDLTVGEQTILNNVAATSLTDLVFSTSLIRGAQISYVIYRASTATPTGTFESGIVHLIYDANGSAGNKWFIGQNSVGDAGIVFTVTDTGQLKYASSDIGATGYGGKISYSVKLFNQ